MNDTHIPQDQSHLQTHLDSLFAQGPDDRSTSAALSRLANTLAEAKQHTIFYGKLDHPITGTLFLAMRSNVVVEIDFGVTELDFTRRISEHLDSAIYFDVHATAEAIEQVEAYLDGKSSVLSLLTDIGQLTQFQQLVLKETARIKRGQTVTYGDIARRIGRPKAVRAVGQALGRNPIPILIPCHRVIASNGTLGGYSGGGGLTTKANLLKLEGAFAV